MAVEARYSAPVTRVVARSRKASDYLVAAAHCGTGASIEHRGRRLILPPGGIDCLRYHVDLTAAAGAEPLSRQLAPGSIAVSPTVWLWRPRLRDDDQVLARFKLPDGMRVAVPWKPARGAASEFVFGPSPQSGSAIAVIGSFESQRRMLGETEIRVALLGRQSKSISALADWVRDAAGNVSLAYGRFPVDFLSVLLIPVSDRAWGTHSAVPFGRVVRDGGASVELIIDPTRPLAEFYTQWAPTHEFAHLMLPYLAREQRWVAEGFASYYQNVLLTRAGHYSESLGWQRLLEGFERGRDSMPTLSPNAASASSEHSTRMKIYWSGAALALLADVALRQRSGNRESLDSVLNELQRCCLPSSRTWSGPELFAQLDSFVHEPLFASLYSRHADNAGFPDVMPLLEQLGIIVDGAEVRLSDAAPLAAIRRSIFAPGQGRKP